MIKRLAGLLRLVARFGQIAISQAGDDFVALDHQNCRSSNEELTTIVVSHPGNGIGYHLRLIDQRHGS